MASKSIPATSVQAIENRTNYRFTNTDYLWLALQAAGHPRPFPIGGQAIGSDGNKRLALVGDKAMGLVITKLWFRDATVLTRKVLSDQILAIASNTNLVKVGQDLNLELYINRNPAAGEIIAPVLMASTVEALLGAIFLDSGENLVAVEAAMRSMGLIQ